VIKLTFTSRYSGTRRQTVMKLDYKWVALSNTTLGVLMVTINQSIILIALPDIFRGIRVDPLQPGNTSYLLWMILGFLVVTAVLVVNLGRLGDMFGDRVQAVIAAYDAGLVQPHT
jgi:MFS family permease